MNTFRILIAFFKGFKSFFYNINVLYFYRYDKSRFGYLGKNVQLDAPIFWMNPKQVFLYDNTHLSAKTSFLIFKGQGNFIMKKSAGAAPGLTVITNGHTTHPPLGKHKDEVHKNAIGDINKDVIIEEDVWIGANVTLLPGISIGRGAIIGACSLVNKDIPPYAIAVGNPAKVIRFKYTIDEIVEHEKILYPENERIDEMKLKSNFEKFSKI
ncbi:MAG: hypothetical protein J1F12_08850 [Muribaculaceae bacterium]|nr:hypothetical protein [Muribaculaceae bacterium]